jgi:PAS domain S-box-containing protein
MTRADRAHSMDTDPTVADQQQRPSRHAALERENARLRAALARAGIDIEDVLGAPAAPRDEPAAAPLHRAAPNDSQRRLDNLFAMKTLGVLFWGPDFTLTEVNDAFLGMTGLRRDEAIGKSWQELTPPEFHEVARHAIAQLFASGESTPYEKQYFRKDGSRWWGLFAARKVDGEVLEVVLDVTDRRQVQEALRESEEQLRLIVDSARDYAILTTDTQGRVVQWWPGAAAVFGWQAEEIVGQPIAVTFTPEDRASGQPDRELATARAQGAAPDVRWHQRRDGTRVFIEGHMSALRSPHGDLRGFMKIGQDMTHRRAVEEQRRQVEADLRHLNETLEARVDARTAELRHALEALHMQTRERAQAEEALRQAQKMEAVGQLTGGLAHDFNNLLTGIIGCLDMLHTRTSHGRYDDLGRYLAAARGAADRAAMLTHRLLAFSRRQTLDPRPTDLNALVQGMVDLLQRSIGPHITLEVAAAPDLWVTLCDPNQQENVLLNLCINARDAMPEGGRLTIGTANVELDAPAARAWSMEPGRYVALRVADTGTGMPPEVVAHAFEPFYTTKPAGQGTGLGLSMAYGFARQSGGQVRIDSAPGRGTTVTVYLPRHEGRIDADAGAGVPPPVAEPEAATDETVLVVDDDATVRMLVGEVLRELGYATIEAGDGHDGLRILQSQAQMDLLVTDVGLPGGINGRQLADAARAVHPSLKVLFITGYARNSELGTLEPGMQVMVKPFGMDALAARIRDLLRSRPTA